MGSSGFNVGGYSGSSNNPTKIDLNINNNFVGPVQFDANNPLGIDQIDVNILSDIKKYDYGQADIEEFDFTDDKKPYDELFNLRYDLKFTYESIQDELDNLEREYNTLTGKIYHAPHTDEDLKRKEELENKISTLKGYLAEINEMSMDYVKITNIKNKKQYIKSLKDEKKKYLELLAKNISDNDRAYYSELLAKVNEKLSIYEKVNADYADLMKRISNLVSEYNSLKYDNVDNFIDDTKIEDMPDYNKDDVSVETPTVPPSVTIPSGTGNYDYSDLQTTGVPKFAEDHFYWIQKNGYKNSQWNNWVGENHWAYQVYLEKKAWWTSKCLEKGIGEVVGIRNGLNGSYPENKGTIPIEVLNGSFYAGQDVSIVDMIMDACDFYGYDNPEDIIAIWLHESNCGKYEKNGSMVGPVGGSFGWDPYTDIESGSGVNNRNNPAQAVWGTVAMLARAKYIFSSDDMSSKQARANALGAYANGADGFLKYGFNAVNKFYDSDGNLVEYSITDMVFNQNPDNHQYGFMVLSDAVKAYDLEKLAESHNNAVSLNDWIISFDSSGKGFTYTITDYDPSKLSSFHSN